MEMSQYELMSVMEHMRFVFIPFLLELYSWKYELEFGFEDTNLWYFLFVIRFPIGNAIRKLVRFPTKVLLFVVDSNYIEDYLISDVGDWGTYSWSPKKDEQVFFGVQAWLYFFIGAQSAKLVLH